MIEKQSKGGIILESILPIWQEFCSFFAAAIIAVCGMIGLIVVIGKIVKNIVL